MNFSLDDFVLIAGHIADLIISYEYYILFDYFKLARFAIDNGQDYFKIYGFIKIVYFIIFILVFIINIVDLTISYHHFQAGLD